MLNQTSTTNPRPWNIVGDLVLVKDHKAKSFQPKYKEDFRVVHVYGTNALQVSDKRGKLHNVHITDLRKINMTEKNCSTITRAYNNKVEPPNT